MAMCENCSHNVICRYYKPGVVNDCRDFLGERAAAWIKGNSYPTYSDDTGILVNCTKYTCSACNFTYFENGKPFEFCPGCGAEMIGING